MTVTQVTSEILVEFSVYTWVGIYCGRYKYCGRYLQVGNISLDSKWTMESPRMARALSRGVSGSHHARRRKSTPQRALYTRRALQAHHCQQERWCRLPRLLLSQKLLRNRWLPISTQLSPHSRRSSSHHQQTPATAATLEAWSPSSIAKWHCRS